MEISKQLKKVRIMQSLRTIILTFLTYYRILACQKVDIHIQTKSMFGYKERKRLFNYVKKKGKDCLITLKRKEKIV